MEEGNSKKGKSHLRDVSLACLIKWLLRASLEQDEAAGLDYSEKCRMRRCHRRIQMRRQHHPKLLLSYLGQGIGEVGKKMESSSSREVVGAISIPGRQRVMEDTISIRPNLCLPEINQRRPIDFFAVYDGHGGRHVASMCKERMHEVLEEELMRMRNNVDMGGSGTSSPRGRRQPLEWQRMEEAWRRVFKSCFFKIDEMASCICSECGGVGYECGCPPSVLKPTGSTAVVVVLTDETIIVANCGDSRAVLSRSGSAIPLSYDHKPPDKREERARIEAYGGRVVFTDGARVEGVLSMSRTGDNNLKPYMTSEPEMILASDGLWDVISSDIACGVGRECLRHSDPAGDLSSRPSSVEGDTRGAMFSSRRACSAAALLTRLALCRNSCDNISVIVVDLKRNHTALDYSEKCRMRRCHRRIQMRRQHHPKLLLSYLGQGIGEVGKKMESSSSREVVGAISIPGRQRVMEDTISIRPNLCLPEINQRRPIDFFAVYDGHGGRHVASMCKERMHEVLEEELMHMRNNVDMGGSGTSSPRGR
ncbi:hypothetical protein H5410_016597 [Solanum commersonii]|uniref:protein-serine/threonine phosphatase n=1 Tax=Solanum commersonii TaxID=4109 RepID=A0A9J5ZWP2_SOLCO|nr:hypothetical protein H5410_016597 [Solanum commersonii]